MISRDSDMRLYQTEYEIQRDAIKAMNAIFPGLLYCASAGGMHSGWKAGKSIKATGYRNGFPDLFIYKPSGQYHGLAIEFKTVKGNLSSEQIAWGDSLTRSGYMWVVCRTAESAINRITEYLAG
jgi:hypothetical protein